MTVVSPHLFRLKYLCMWGPCTNCCVQLGLGFQEPQRQKPQLQEHWGCKRHAKEGTALHQHCFLHTFLSWATQACMELSPSHGVQCTVFKLLYLTLVTGRQHRSRSQRARIHVPLLRCSMMSRHQGAAHGTFRSATAPEPCSWCSTRICATRGSTEHGNRRRCARAVLELQQQSFRPGGSTQRVQRSPVRMRGFRAPAPNFNHQTAAQIMFKEWHCAYTGLEQP